jgi:hypothetical protein
MTFFIGPDAFAIASASTCRFAAQGFPRPPSTFRAMAPKGYPRRLGHAAPLVACDGKPRSNAAHPEPAPNMAMLAKVQDAFAAPSPRLGGRG